MVGVERARVPNTIAVSASVTLGVRDVARATRAIRALPHVEVTSVGPRDLHLHLPSRAYRATLDRLAALGTMQHLDERRDNLDSALATAAHQPPTASSANALVNLRDRIAFAHLDVHLEPI
jgi:hypothetical protein